MPAQDPEDPEIQDTHFLCLFLAHEESDFTSIQERIRDWQKERMTTAAVGGVAEQDKPSGASGGTMPALPIAAGIDDAGTEDNACMTKASADAATAGTWLCPIRSDSERRGILQMTVTEYLDLVDRSGRMIRSDKAGIHRCRSRTDPDAGGRQSGHTGGRRSRTSHPESALPPERFPACAVLQTGLAGVGSRALQWRAPPSQYHRRTQPEQRSVQQPILGNSDVFF